MRRFLLGVAIATSLSFALIGTAVAAAAQLAEERQVEESTPSTTSTSAAHQKVRRGSEIADPEAEKIAAEELAAEEAATEEAESTLDELEVPTALLPVYQACGTRYGISWEVLAAINKAGTGFRTAGTEDPVEAICSAAREVLADARRYERVIAFPES